MALHRLNNEEEVLAGVAGGDEMAFTKLFHAYHVQIGEFVQLLTHDLDSTAEIVQEVFAKVWINRESLPMVNRFDSYLFILCRNHTLNYIRKRAAERKKHEVYLLEVDETLELMPEDTPYDSHELVERAVQLLPPQQQRVFILRQQGMKNPEISQLMNLSLESVKKYQHLAIKSIKNFVQLGMWVVLVIWLVALF